MLDGSIRSTAEVEDEMMAAVNKTGVAGGFRRRIDFSREPLLEALRLSRWLTLSRYEHFRHELPARGLLGTLPS
jgi:hypothetical protein